MINFRLFPDIVFGEERYCVQENGKIPLVQLFLAHDDIDRLLLVGMGSLGKSTSLRLLEAELLCLNMPCVLYECKALDPHAVMAEIKTFPTGTVFLFDGCEELPYALRNDFRSLLESLSEVECKIILSLRAMPHDENETAFAEEVLASYKIAEMQPFREEQIDILTGGYIDKNSGYYKLLSNTMFLFIHLELFWVRLARRSVVYI